MSKIDRFWPKKRNVNYTCNLVVFELQNIMVPVPVLVPILFVYTYGKMIRICLKEVEISLQQLNNYKISKP